MIARSLERRLRDHLRGKGSLFATDVSPMNDRTERPLLVLFDRNFDVPSIVKHEWTYAPLVHDVLAMRLNRVDIKGDGPAGAAGKKSYDLEAADDAFWRENGDAQFPVVAEEVEKALGEYKKAMADITSATSGGTKEGAGEGNTNSARNEESRNDTSALVSAVASLPQLQERKRVIDKHTNIATALLGEIKQRGLDEYHVVEEDLLAGKPDRAAMMGLLDATGRGTPEDKLRLAIVRAAAAARQRARDGTDAEDAETYASDAEAVEGALRASGADTAALDFFQRAARLDASLGGGSTGVSNHHHRSMSDDDSGGGDLLDWADKLYGQSIDAVAKGVQSLLRGDRRGAVARAAEALAANQSGVAEVDTFAYFDPKAPPSERERLPPAPPPGAPPAASFRKAIVFVAGGGNYAEYRECVALGKPAGRRADDAYASRSGTGAVSVVYGATELVTGAEFVGQLAELGRKSRR
jgi:hypothetical protein